VIASYEPFGDFTGVIPEPDLIEQFREIIYEYYGEYGREMPWRETFDPYEILVSEVMLQQTQVSRVLPKYLRFLSRWPAVGDLSSASLREVLELWQGLGYNRRGRGLHVAAKIIVDRYDGIVPRDGDSLRSLPMVGASTAAAIRAFAFGEPVVYLETNVRRVYLHFFFDRRDGVRDSEIFPIAELALDRDDPRSWAYALMDYGAFLRERPVDPNRRSASYSRQAPFEGSNRQIRGRVLAALIEKGELGADELSLLPFERERIALCTDELVGEGMIAEQEGRYFISRH
jgi:A/G-specific adenine glycosylase